MVKYVFFDLDETLIDIKYAQNEAIKSLYKKFGFDRKIGLVEFVKKWDELTDYHYKFYTVKQISYEEQRRRRVVDLFASFDVKLERDAMDVYFIYLTEFENSWIVYDGSVETLELLKDKGIVLGLISNGDYEQQVQKMKKVGVFEMFDYVNTSSQFEYSKPDERLFEKIFDMHGIKYDELVYVGNSYSKDIVPCRNLGIKTIFVNRKNIKIEDKDLVSVENLKEIIPILESWNK